MPWWVQPLVSTGLIWLASWFAGKYIGNRLYKKTHAARIALWDLLDKIDSAHQRLSLIEARQRGLESSDEERLRWISFYLEEKSE